MVGISNLHQDPMATRFLFGDHHRFVILFTQEVLAIRAPNRGEGELWPVRMDVDRTPGLRVLGLTTGLCQVEA